MSFDPELATQDELDAIAAGRDALRSVQSRAARVIMGTHGLQVEMQCTVGIQGCLVGLTAIREIDRSLERVELFRERFGGIETPDPNQSSPTEYIAEVVRTGYLR